MSIKRGSVVLDFFSTFAHQNLRQGKRCSVAPIQTKRPPPCAIYAGENTSETNFLFLLNFELDKSRLYKCWITFLHYTSYLWVIGRLIRSAGNQQSRTALSDLQLYRCTILNFIVAPNWTTLFHLRCALIH